MAGRRLKVQLVQTDETTVNKYPRQKNKHAKWAESTFYNYFKNTRGKDATSVRFPDTHDVNKHNWSNPHAQKVIVEKRPSDFIVVDKGETFFAEVKATINQKGVTPSLFDTQKSQSRVLMAAGADYRFYVFSVDRKSWYRFAGDEVNRSWDWEEVEHKKVDFLPTDFRG